MWVLNHTFSLIDFPLFSAWLKSICYAEHTTVEKLGRKLFPGVRTSKHALTANDLHVKRMKKICIQTGCNDNSVQLLLHPFITRHEVWFSCLSECIIINNSFATSTVNMNSGNMRVFISLSRMLYGCHLYTLVYSLSFLKKTLCNETSHFMRTNSCKFSFSDAVHFNFHLSLTLKTMQSYSGVFSYFRTTNHWMI